MAVARNIFFLYTSLRIPSTLKWYFQVISLLVWSWLNRLLLTAWYRVYQTVDVHFHGVPVLFLPYIVEDLLPGFLTNICTLPWLRFLEDAPGFQDSTSLKSVFLVLFSKVRLSYSRWCFLLFCCQVSGLVFLLFFFLGCLGSSGTSGTAWYGGDMMWGTAAESAWSDEVTLASTSSASSHSTIIHSYHCHVFQRIWFWHCYALILCKKSKRLTNSAEIRSTSW